MASRNSKGGTLFSALLEEFRDQAGPPGLMAGAQARSAVAVKVFVKQNQVAPMRSEEHTSELQSRGHLVCRLLLEKKNLPYTSPSFCVSKTNVYLSAHSDKTNRN